MKCDAGKSKLFIKVCDFMITELGLKGNELLIYALIYSLADSSGKCSVKAVYLSERIGCSLNSVFRSLRNLNKRGLIELSESPFDKRRTVITLKSSAVKDMSGNNSGICDII